MTAFIVAIAALAVAPPSATTGDAIRYVAIAFLLILLGLFISVMVSKEQVERDRVQAEMITGGENFCYLSVDPKERHIEPLPLWIDATGLLLNLTYHIYPKDADEAHGGRYDLLDNHVQGWRAGGEFEMLHKCHRTVKNVLPTHQGLDWVVAFTARNGGWKQYIHLTRMTDGFMDTTKVIHDDGRVLWPPEG